MMKRHGHFLAPIPVAIGLMASDAAPSEAPVRIHGQARAGCGPETNAVA
jgi:hypothetical protein